MALKKKLQLHLKKGALRADLGVAKGDKIDNPLDKKRKQFAINAAKGKK